MAKVRNIRIHVLLLLCFKLSSIQYSGIWSPNFPQKILPLKKLVFPKMTVALIVSFLFKQPPRSHGIYLFKEQTKETMFILRRLAKISAKRANANISSVNTKLPLSSAEPGTMFGQHSNNQRYGWSDFFFRSTLNYVNVFKLSVPLRSHAVGGDDKASSAWRLEYGSCDPTSAICLLIH